LGCLLLWLRRRGERRLEDLVREWLGVVRGWIRKWVPGRPGRWLGKETTAVIRWGSFGLVMVWEVYRLDPWYFVPGEWDLNILYSTEWRWAEKISSGWCSSRCIREQSLFVYRPKKHKVIFTCLCILMYAYEELVHSLLNMVSNVSSLWVLNCSHWLELPTSFLVQNYITTQPTSTTPFQPSMHSTTAIQ